MIIPSKNGYRIKFLNGYSVSVQNSPDHHCGNVTAETAVIDPQGHLVEYDGDTIQIFQTAEDLLTTMNYVARL